MTTEGLQTQGNRRRSFRAEVDGCAIVHAPDGVAVRCRVVDLGLGGVRLAEPYLDSDVLAGVPVTLELECAGAGWVVQCGRVVRHAGGELAIVFDVLSPEVEDFIEDEVLGALEADLKPRVVVVDGSVPRREEVVDLLREAGCAPLEASTPLEAVALVERSRNHVCAVLLAETMSQTAAAELHDFLAESHPTIAVHRIDSGEHRLRDLIRAIL
jgi:hypothetical protein